ncbi:hypothetical protein MC885_010388 [Smutsia gigantea]|nr:hypothetical protein MC885_010388 [Smutsia gigantea]
MLRAVLRRKPPSPVVGPSRGAPCHGTPFVVSRRCLFLRTSRWRACNCHFFLWKRSQTSHSSWDGQRDREAPRPYLGSLLPPPISHTRLPGFSPGWFQGPEAAPGFPAKAQLAPGPEKHDHDTPYLLAHRAWLHSSTAQRAMGDKRLPASPNVCESRLEATNPMQPFAVAFEVIQNLEDMSSCQ